MLAKRWRPLTSTNAQQNKLKLKTLLFHSNSDINNVRGCSKRGRFSIPVRYFFGVAFQINESMKYTKSYIKSFSLNMLK